ncbi:unnamed protein product [Caenorhabditis auriculariae]|uniref:Uncharacterized protein n=1 Tax=Caenorhabditis auriculariae TaxID=2777116 RepID=A0A8S1HC53_9PELO|nr:unnamed protein product [Caenorhabditis auriculariae]
MPKRGFEHIFLLLFGLSIIALFSFSWLFKFIIQPISFRYDFSQINSYENAVSLEPIGKNFETLKIVQTDPQGSEVRTRTHLLSHRLLLEKIANISVEAFGRSWTYNDICFKPRSALLDLDFGGLSYMEEFVKIVRGYLPCYLVTPINSFWDRLSLNQIIRRNDLETLEQLEVYLELEFDLPLLQECGKSSFNKNALKCFDSIKSLISSRMRNESDIVTKEDFGRFQLSSKRMQYLSDEQLECLDPSDKCHLDQFVRPLNFYNVCDAMSQISRKSGRFPLTMYMLFRGDRRKGSMFPILDCQNEDDVRIFFEKLLELESPLARSGISLPRFPNYTKTLSRGSSAIHGEWNNEELLVGGNISEKKSEGEPRIEVADYFRLQISLMKAETLVRIMLSTGEERRDFWTKENAQFILDEWTNALRATIESFNRDSASVFLFETKSEDPVLVENSTAARLIFIFCSLLMLFYYLVPHLSSRVFRSVSFWWKFNSTQPFIIGLRRIGLCN